MTSPTLGTALITGASSGIGAVYADRLAHRGYDLILVARNRERLDALAQRLRGETSRQIDVLVADLGAPDDLHRVEATLRERPIAMLVNNAGVAAVTPLLGSDVDAMEAMIELNVTALTRLTYAAVPGFVARGAGTIVNIASVVALVPEMLNGVYGASKAYVLAFSRSLHHELSDRGIRVQAVLPGGTITELWDLAGAPVSAMPAENRARFMTAEDCVDASLAGLDLGELVTIPPLSDASDWEAFETLREALRPQLFAATPAPRYRIKAVVG
ncbi:MAG: SDR family oxidoreductase [Vulcanimicrobiaceae bacterium]|jgi:short-subunit dehydrogenase